VWKITKHFRHIHICLDDEGVKMFTLFSKNDILTLKIIFMNSTFNKTVFLKKVKVTLFISVCPWTKGACPQPRATSHWLQGDLTTWTCSWGRVLGPGPRPIGCRVTSRSVRVLGQGQPPIGCRVTSRSGGALGGGLRLVLDLHVRTLLPRRRATGRRLALRPGGLRLLRLYLHLLLFLTGLLVLLLLVAARPQFVHFLRGDITRPLDWKLTSLLIQL